RRLAAAEIGVPHRVAVHRGIVEWRQVDWRDDIAREHAPTRILQSDCFGFRHRLHPLGDQPLDVLDREQRAAEREAIVDELGHQALRTRATTTSSGAAFSTRMSATASTS